MLLVAGSTAGVAMLTASAYVGVVVHRSSRPVLLPEPAGAYAVGRTEHTWTDPARDGRALSVWTWYPTVAGTGRRADYLPGQWARLHLPFPVGLAETSFDDVVDPAREDGTPAPGRFPAVVLEPGLGLSAPQYAVLAEDLASRGLVVIGVTPTGSANLTVIDGEVVGSDDAGNPPGFAGEHTAHDEAIAADLLPVWVADARFALRRASTELSGQVDARLVGYVGHSFGGSAALEACRSDDRCGVAVDLDGAIYGTVETTGLRVPSLLVGHEGSCVTGVCEPESATDREDQAVGRAFAAVSHPAPRALDIAGTAHFSFSDWGIYYLAQPLRLLVPVGAGDGRESLGQVTDLVGETVEAALRRH